MEGGVGMKFRTRKGNLSLGNRTVKGARIQQLSVAKVGKAWLLLSKSEVMKPDADASKNNIQIYLMPRTRRSHGIAPNTGVNL